MEDKNKTDPRGGWTSASNALADSLCPGRHLYQKECGTGEEEPNDYATFGDDVHEAMRSGTDPQDPKALSTVERMREIDGDLMLQFFGDDAEKVKLRREERFWVTVADKATGKKYKHSGQVDVVYALKGRALVTEYKSLAGDVNASPTNMQLRDQAVLVRGNLLMNEVGTSVNQPLVDGKPPIALYKKDDLDRAEKEMFERVVASNTPGMGRVAGEKQCQWCTAKLKCPEYAKFTGAIVPSANMGDLPVAQWPPEMMAAFLEKRGVASKWLDETYAEIKRQVKANPGLVPGWELEEGSEKTRITDMGDLFMKLIALKLQPGEIIIHSKLTMENLEILVRKATGAKGKGLKAELKRLLDGVSEKKRDESSLVRRSP